MNKIVILALFVMLGTLISGCNVIARNYGGNINIDLDKNQKLLNVTWKGNSLWVLTRKMVKEDIVESYEFYEKSAFGIVEGKVILNERR